MSSTTRRRTRYPLPNVYSSGTQYSVFFNFFCIRVSHGADIDIVVNVYIVRIVAPDVRSSIRDTCSQLNCYVNSSHP